MKKNAKRIMSALLAVTVAFGVSVAATGCKSGPTSDSSSQRRDNKKYDATKTQINVQFYQAGYGEDWIYDYEAKFEEAYKDYSFEEGKTGVQVWHNGDMSTWTTTKMSSSKYDIFFFENERYYNFLDGTLEDLTDIVKENIPGEDESIEDKLNDQQKDFFAVKSSASSEGKYYALPHYYGTYGIVYNIELFDKMNYYFNTDGEVMASKGVTNKVKSNGPDGKTGVIDGVDYSLDDGLPATYEQFYDLCGVINSTNNTPLCWPGKYYEHHLLNLYDNLVAGYEGKEQMLLNYGFNEGVDAATAPKATDLINVDNNGNVTFDEPTAITTANGYELARQAGKYYAYGFLSEIMKPQNRWYTLPGSFSGSYSHTDNQRDFLMFGTNLSNTKKTTAMLVDGPWWQNEAKTVFADMVKKGGEQYAATSRKFGWMPLPHATEEKVGDKTVYSDYLKTFVCMKSGLSSGVKDAAKKFLQFICSDEMLVSFTKATGTLRAYDYEVSDSDMNELSEFSKSVINYVKRSDVIYKFSSGDYYNRNSDKLNYDTVYQTVIGSNTAKNPAYAIHEYQTGSAAWFNAYYSTMKSNWSK